MGLVVFSHASSKLKTSKTSTPQKSTSIISTQTPFPEESFRKEWDRGCSDWRDLFEGKSNFDTLKLEFERANGQYHLWGQARLKPEPGESVEQLVKSLNDSLDQSKDYRTWIYAGINEHPKKGESYFVELNDLFVRNETQSHIFLTGPFDFKIATFKVGGNSTIELKWDPVKFLDCEDSQKVKIKSVGPIRKFRMYPRKDVLEWMIGELSVFRKGEQFVDIQTRIVLRPSKLVFALIPLKVIENELKYRAQRVFQNLTELRRQKVWRSGSVFVGESSSNKSVGN